MTSSVAGDVDYRAHGEGYTRQRQADPRIARLVQRALGDTRTVLNVGAGGGSYEPVDRYVLAVEPAAAMRAQRPPHLAAVRGTASPAGVPRLAAARHRPSGGPVIHRGSVAVGGPARSVDRCHPGR